MTLYRLSTRQRKELLTRGVPIRVAIPLPPGDDPPDPLAFARAALADDMGEHVVSAEIDELRVDPTARGGGLTGLIGGIVDTAAHPRSWTVGVAAVVATLQFGRPRHAPTSPQWPGDALSEGRWISKEESG